MLLRKVLLDGMHGNGLDVYCDDMVRWSSAVILFSWQSILDRLNAHKRDLEALNKAAQDMMDADGDGLAMNDIQELIERFETLQKSIMEKKEFFKRVTSKWQIFSDQKRKMNSFFRNTQNIVTRRQVRNSEECKKQIDACKVSIHALNNYSNPGPSSSKYDYTNPRLALIPDSLVS